jgi:hypothetical protein
MDLPAPFVQEFSHFIIFNAHKCLIIHPIPILVGKLHPSGAIPPLAGKWGPFEDEPAPSCAESKERGTPAQRK